MNLLVLSCSAQKIIPFIHNKLSPLPGFELKLQDLQANVLPIEPSLIVCKDKVYFDSKFVW